MSNDVPVLIMAFIRPDLITRAMEYLSKSAPPILYVMGDDRETMLRHNSASNQEKLL